MTALWISTSARLLHPERNGATVDAIWAAGWEQCGDAKVRRPTAEPPVRVAFALARVGRPGHVHLIWSGCSARCPAVR